MSTADVLLVDIIREPERDDLRLIYADWLDDHGEPERAEFIRVQVELARLVCACRTLGHVTCHCCALETRGQELLGVHWRDWLDGIVPGAFAWRSASYFGFAVTDPDGDPIGWAVEFHRGFVEAVECRCQDWLAHGPALVRCQPVRKVRLSDKRPAGPLHESRSYGWWREDPRVTPGPDVLPAVICARLSGGSLVYFRSQRQWYPTEADALAALSAACLAWAKSVKEG